ncbi:hypothetical protein EHW66_12300 [Erwinia psidii]|uniref:hypothetical protein n=1 Tax=Erwinia psidii TaxID=69224 RepID=UPI00226B1D34|nr:hypothetical protein [Erwinia psidii]MCX8965752.1 hypothetical protein [Erwinia psidii]
MIKDSPALWNRQTAEYARLFCLPVLDRRKCRNIGQKTPINCGIVRQPSAYTVFTDAQQAMQHRGTAPHRADQQNSLYDRR